MIQIEPNTTIPTISTAEGQRQHVVGVVGRGGDVQEEDEVDAHLRHREQPPAPPARQGRRSGWVPHRPEGARRSNADRQRQARSDSRAGPLETPLSPAELVAGREVEAEVLVRPPRRGVFVHATIPIR